MATTMPQLTIEFESNEARVTIDENGVATAEILYYAPENKVVPLLKSGKTCPLEALGLIIYPRFKIAQAESIEGGNYAVRLTWVGLAPNFQDYVGVPKPKLEPRADTEPIGAHPFLRVFANKQNAEFTSASKFVSFRLNLPDGSDNPYYGVEEFYTPSLTVGERVIVEFANVKTADFLKVGRIAVPDLETLGHVRVDIPDIGLSERNYILSGYSLETVGMEYVILTRKYDLSGPRGWDEDIYDYNDTGDRTSVEGLTIGGLESEGLDSDVFLEGASGL